MGETEFEGRPAVKVELGDGKSSTAPISAQEAKEYRVVITREGDRYFWASRNNLPLSKHESGGYVTYVAQSGAGYIRVLAPFMRGTQATSGQGARA